MGTVRVYRGLPNSPSRASGRTPCALTIGNFDGVHRGHQVLLQHLRAAAARLSLTTCVMTFEPHPREFFAAQAQDPTRAPTRIANLRDTLQALADHGVERVIVEHFNRRFANLTPEQFIRDVLVDGCRVRYLIIGHDFCFGARRAGNIALLQQAGEHYGFQVEVLPPVLENGERISSSAVRAALAAADFKLASQLLGHSYCISGHIVHGRKLGRSIGFPTANIRIAHQRPAITGIFVVQVHGVSEQPWPGVASMGVRPTVDDSGQVLLETHLLDFDQDLYGKVLRIEFLKKLRNEEKYDDLATLISAIRQDAQQARAFFCAHNSVPHTVDL